MYNPCFQTLIMTLPEGFTRYVLTRESTTDVVATAGTIADVSFTTPQHAAVVSFADTYIPPLNANIIGSANYSANETGGPWECGAGLAMSTGTIRVSGCLRPWLPMPGRIARGCEWKNDRKR